MSAITETLQDSRKIVIKVGSNVMSTPDGHIDREAVGSIVEQINVMVNDGKQIIVVSSGAGAFGAGAINKLVRRKDVHYYQALCAIGQVEMMMAYKEFFGRNGTHVAQLLLTRDDFANEDRTLHIRNTLFTLIDEGIVPIINENDTVSVDEIKSIGDNDTLGAFTAQLWNADCYIILSDIDGVFDKNPKDHDDAELIEEVYDIDGLLQEIDISGKSSFGTGGIHTKIEAARHLGVYGIPTLLLNGETKDVILKARSGEVSGTGFFFND
ncbi:MAG: glutamate 5-kinase [Eubacteriaceae bacterium]|jgi:glutamate 5-kinase|nr:glutamate 5-kinase [Eubacteriaceae bacterium]